MKKNIVMFFFFLLIFTGCDEKKEKEINYGNFIFTDIVWTRDNGHDLETLIFKSDGSFTYSCSCGNPINDSDLCESYVYDKKTKEIKLDCFEITEEMVEKIKIINISKDSLELDFDGDIRKFEKENN